MKNTKDAVKYAIETLNLTPEEFFSLVESSRDYTGDDYSRWLANEVVKIAEKDGVGFSQLLVKKFSIIQSLSEGTTLSIRPCWVEEIKSMIEAEEDNIFSIDFEHLGNPIEGIDWYSGVDYSNAISDFTMSVLPTEISDKISNNEEVCFITTLSKDASNKGSDLYQACKSAGITCKTEGSLMLYRMISMAEAFYSEEEFTFAFFTDVDFLYNSDNKNILRLFLKHFTCQGIAIKSTDLYDGTFVSGKYAFVKCSPRPSKRKAQDYISLFEYVMEDGEPINKGSKRYTSSSEDMLNSLRVSAQECKVMVYSETLGKLHTENKLKGCEDAYGYLNINLGNVWLTCFPDTNATEYIPITKKNLEDVIIYYGLSSSLKNFGLPCEFPMLVNGSTDYDLLLANCFPIFLLSNGSKFKDFGSITTMGKVERLESSFDIEYSDLVAELFALFEVNFSFESKNLVDVCKGFLDYLRKEVGISVSGLSFDEIRKESSNEDLNKYYLSALTDAMDYVKTLYRKME